MKSIKPVFAALMVVALMAADSAHTEEENEGASGMLPTSIFYGLDIFSEKITVFFKPDEDKIPALFQDAGERIAEIRKLAEEGRLDKIDRAVKSHSSLIRKIRGLYGKNGKESLESYARLEKSIESHMIEVNELDQTFPERDTLQEKLYYDTTMNLILTPLAELNMLLSQQYRDYENKIGTEKFNEDISRLRKNLGVVGIIGMDVDNAISLAEEWLKKSEGNPFFTQDHYKTMKNDLALAVNQKESGNFFGAKALAAELSEHIEREMFLADDLSEEEFKSVVEIGNDEIFQLTAFPVNKEISGRKIRMYSYNGDIPGPLIKVKQGSTIYINFTNRIDMETTVHWHGIRLDNKFDGVPHETQEPVMPGESFLYQLKFPDEGIYWYHPHAREDKQQELGLYGNIIVEPSSKGYYNNVSKEVFLFLDDIKLAKNDADAFGKDFTRFALMGRFGNVMLINGKEEYNLDAAKGDAVRFYITDSANARPFNFSISGHRLKMIGSDSGKNERESMADS
ncbi:multicopper oxidase domain-containing protein, partial [Candidatus Woesearchaeota archaeon]|nr:multicopper oxidase domain-containing protein [Candidatus Woesearchaeota archaeon]